MKQIKKEALERIKAEIEEQIDGFECLSLDSARRVFTVHPKVDSDSWTGFALILQPDDFEDEEIPQPGLFAEEEHVKAKTTAVRRSRFVFRQVKERLANHYPFLKGQYDFSTEGFNMNSFRSCVTRCFHGCKHLINPELQQPIWPEFDCNVEQLDEENIRVYIWRKSE